MQKCAASQLPQNLDVIAQVGTELLKLNLS